MTDPTLRRDGQKLVQAARENERCERRNKLRAGASDFTRILH